MTTTAARSGVSSATPDRAAALRLPSLPAWRRFLLGPLTPAPGRTLLFALFGSLLLLLAGVLEYATAPPVQPARTEEPAGPAEIDLRADASSPKLNFTSAETSTSPLAPAPQPNVASRPVEEDPQKDRAAPVEPPALEVTAPPPVVPAAPLVEPPPLAPAAPAAVIEVPEYLRPPHRGDTPMMRLWNRLGLSAALAAAFTAAPALGQIDGDPDKADAILKQLQGVTKSLQDLKTLPQKLTDLDSKISDVEKKITDQLAGQEVSANLRIQGLQRELITLREQYAQLKQELDGLRQRLPAKQPSMSLYPPNGAGSARLRLVNTFTRPISVVVNDRRVYELNPGESRYTDPLAAGTFSYEVLGIQERLSRGIVAGETFLIHVHPR